MLIHSSTAVRSVPSQFSSSAGWYVVVLIYHITTLARGEECKGNAFGSICMSVWKRNSKKSAPIYLMFDIRNVMPVAWLRSSSKMIRIWTRQNMPLKYATCFMMKTCCHSERGSVISDFLVTLCVFVLFFPRRMQAVCCTIQ